MTIKTASTRTGIAVHAVVACSKQTCIRVQVTLVYVFTTVFPSIASTATAFKSNVAKIHTGSPILAGNIGTWCCHLVTVSSRVAA